MINKLIRKPCINKVIQSYPYKFDCEQSLFLLSSVARTMDPASGFALVI